MRDFYVDDGVTSIASIDEAIQFAREAQHICAMGGLRLHKFVCNNTSVLVSIPSFERATETKSLDLTFDDSPLKRPLETHWHIGSDSFTFCINLKDQPSTRRSVLSTVAPLYDPLGLVAPFLQMGKECFRKRVDMGQVGMTHSQMNCNHCGNIGRLILSIWKT